MANSSLNRSNYKKWVMNEFNKYGDSIIQFHPYEQEILIEEALSESGINVERDRNTRIFRDTVSELTLILRSTYLTIDDYFLEATKSIGLYAFMFFDGKPEEWAMIETEEDRIELFLRCVRYDFRNRKDVRSISTLCRRRLCD